MYSSVKNKSWYSRNYITTLSVESMIPLWIIWQKSHTSSLQIRLFSRETQVYKLKHYNPGIWCTKLEVKSLTSVLITSATIAKKGKDQFSNVLSSQVDGIIQKFKIHAGTTKPLIFQPRQRELMVIYVISCQIRISTWGKSHLRNFYAINELRLILVYFPH